MRSPFPTSPAGPPRGPLASLRAPPTARTLLRIQLPRSGLPAARSPTSRRAPSGPACSTPKLGRSCTCGKRSRRGQGLPERRLPGRGAGGGVSALWPCQAGTSATRARVFPNGPSSPGPVRPPSCRIPLLWLRPPRPAPTPGHLPFPLSSPTARMVALRDLVGPRIRTARPWRPASTGTVPPHLRAAMLPQSADPPARRRRP